MGPDPTTKCGSLGMQLDREQGATQCVLPAAPVDTAQENLSVVYSDLQGLQSQNIQVS